LQHLEALLGGGREPRIGGDGEIGVSPDLGSSDPAPELIELRQPEHIGAVHDQRVGRGNVEARFHDRGREQHVVLAVVEGVHRLVELARSHLAVGARHFQFRRVLGEEGRRLVEIGDARHDIERLAAAEAFA
jgi:hypothetical protein